MEDLDKMTLKQLYEHYTTVVSLICEKFGNVECRSCEEYGLCGEYPPTLRVSEVEGTAD